MRFGVHYLPTYIPSLDGTIKTYYEHVFAQAQLAESLGYDDFWVTEHHFHEFGGIVPDPAPFLSALAFKTTKLHLGIAIVVLPLRDPIQTAESYAMVDVISNGRLEFGIARGSTPQEFESLHIDYGESLLRMKEGMEVVQHGWADESVTFHGKVFDYDNVRILPKPLQQPHPPVWVAASRSDDTYRWAGEKGFNLMTLANAGPPDVMRGAVGLYRDSLQAAGHDLASKEVLAKFLIYVAESDEAAEQEAAGYMQNYWAVATARNPAGIGRQDSRAFKDQLAKGAIIAGDPAHCIDLISYWTETLGLTTVSGSFHFGGMPHELAVKNLQLFADKVMPAFG